MGEIEGFAVVGILDGRDVGEEVAGLMEGNKVGAVGVAVVGYSVPELQTMRHLL